MFRGSMVALVTPLSNDQIDVDALRALVDCHIQAGTHAIIVAGTTGEGGLLTDKEKLSAIRHVVEQAQERIPVIAGTAANATAQCIELTQAAMELGVHAALIMTPAYIKPTQEGLYQHFSWIAKQVGIPIILYNVPSRTACDLDVRTVEKLSHISNIIGIKDATADLGRLNALLTACEGRLDIYSGDDITALEWMLQGAKGVISVTANVASRQMAKLADMAIDSDKAGALALNEQLMPLHRALFLESNPIPVKWALSKMGLIKNELRMPLTPLSADSQPALESVLNELNFL